MATKIKVRLGLGLSFLRVGLTAGLLMVLLTGTLAAQQKPEDIPDAPSATRPIPPPDAPSPRPGVDDANIPLAPPADNSDSGMSSSNGLPHSSPDSTGSNSVPPPMPPVKTVPAGSVPKDAGTGEDLDYTIKVTTNLVLVPVMVADAEGRLIGGLQPKDFNVLESGVPQKLKFFTSDPFPLSAAVIIDTGMPDVGLKRVQETLSSLQGAFSQFDEVAIYTYSSRAGRVNDYTSVSKELTVALNEVKGYSGENNGPPVTSGCLLYTSRCV